MCLPQRDCIVSSRLLEEPTARGGVAMGEMKGNEIEWIDALSKHTSLTLILPLLEFPKLRTYWSTSSTPDSILHPLEDHPYTYASPKSWHSPRT